MNIVRLYTPGFELMRCSSLCQSCPLGWVLLSRAVLVGLVVERVTRTIGVVCCKTATGGGQAARRCNLVWMADSY
jgi:hypothetical protein